MKIDRRDALRMGLLAAGSLLMGQNAMSQNICNEATPAQPEGPFYPIQDQADKDRDLTQLSGRSERAEGEVIWVQGTVTDQLCQPIAGVLVEIWQACHTGKYDHPSDPNPAALDPNFQYWGKAVTSADGRYRFRTIVPGAYPAGGGWIRPPHIHFKIQKLGYLELITQMYFAGDALNEKDLYIKRLSQTQRSQVIVPLQNIEGEAHPLAQFNISMEKV